MALIGSLTSGVSALRTFSKSIETIGDNIANASTTAFKGSRTRNEDAFAQTLKSATDFNSTLQIGSGVNVATNRQNFNQGSLGSTGISTDVGIAGNGFFLVQPDPVGAPNTKFYTRDGNFHLDQNGYLVNAQGNKVMGGAIGLTTAVAPIQLPVGGPPPATTLSLDSFSIAENGAITEFYADGTSDSTQQITLFTFSDPTALSRASGNVFTYNPAAGVATGAVPGTAAGTLKQGTLELSNVDLAQEFSELITAQRSFQAGSRIISVSDSVLEEIVNLKR